MNIQLTMYFILSSCRPTYVPFFFVLATTVPLKLFIPHYNTHTYLVYVMYIEVWNTGRITHVFQSPGSETKYKIIIIFTNMPKESNCIINTQRRAPPPYTSSPTAAVAVLRRQNGHHVAIIHACSLGHVRTLLSSLIIAK
jgi:hypothetical protein